jgi:hypothetical protein
MSVQCCVEILRQVVKTLQSEATSSDYNSSCLEYCATIVDRINSVRNYTRNHSSDCDAIRSLWEVLYEESNNHKYPKSRSICTRLLQSDAFECITSCDMESTDVVDCENIHRDDPDLKQTRIQLIRVVATELQQELYRQCLVNDQFENDFEASMRHVSLMSPSFSVMTRVVGVCTMLLKSKSNHYSTEEIYTEWCRLFSYIRVCDIEDIECVQMCNRILKCNMFRSEQIRMFTDANVEEIDVARVRATALSAARSASQRINGHRGMGGDMETRVEYS